MTINVKPETEQLIRQEIQCGHFQSVDEMIVEGVHAWRDRHPSDRAMLEERSRAVDQALEFARGNAVPLSGISIKELIHEGHRV
jgi:Arc/MetJ-type ribon-helix-helix transcriptional regulator